jgi:ABC-type enterochelin transport system ATPase subunit
VEAATFADRIAQMKDGQIHETDVSDDWKSNAFLKAIL